MLFGYVFENFYVKIVFKCNYWLVFCIEYILILFELKNCILEFIEYFIVINYG